MLSVDTVLMSCCVPCCGVLWSRETYEIMTPETIGLQRNPEDAGVCVFGGGAGGREGGRGACIYERRRMGKEGRGQGACEHHTGCRCA